MTALVDAVKFNPTAGGTSNWTVSSAVTGYLTPAQANAVDGQTYEYRAESADLSEWEIGYGVYTSSTTTLARTTVLYNSSGTTSKINFSSAPTVGIVPLARDFKERLDADRTYYVATTGSDSNSGMATTTTGTVTFTNGSSNIGWTSHGRSVGDVIGFTTSGTLPTNFLKMGSPDYIVYYVKTVVDANTITVSRTSGGSAISAGSAGSGTHTATKIAPFLTLQKPYDNLADNIDINNKTIIILVAGGTYTAGVKILKALVGGGVIYMQGDTVTYSNCLISITGTGPCFRNQAYHTTNLAFYGFKLTSTGASYGVANDVNTMNLGFGYIEFGGFNTGTPGTPGGVHIAAGGNMSLDAAYTVSGGCDRHIQAYGKNAYYADWGNTKTLLASFTVNYMVLSDVGALALVRTAFTVGAFTVTGSKFYVARAALIDTAGAGTSWFPGTVAGTTTAPGAYT